MTPTTTTEAFLREQLLDRRQRLEALMGGLKGADELARLLREIDSALARMDAGSYGVCEICHEPMEETLACDPLLRYCLDHLTAEQRNALDRDLQLASQIQKEMLPERHAHYDSWEIFYHYQPLGPVSGDYCDVVSGTSNGQPLFFALGDASGNGVAASMLMARLHAIFRTLIGYPLPLHEIVGRASRAFRESALSPYYATLVCGRANSSGEIEICNAGHCPPLLLRNGEVAPIEATGVPLGLFSEIVYSCEVLRLEPGDCLFLYTDGLSEAHDPAGEEFGESRLPHIVPQCRLFAPRELVGACLQELERFLAGAPLADDLSVMVIRRC